jgi:type IV pilus assembly protein PilY1
MKKKLFQMAFAAFLPLMQPAALAEDIDLFVGDTSGASPNVLIVLDNSSNWSAANQAWPTDSNPPVDCGNDCNKQGYYELKAIRTVINSLPTDANDKVAMNIGLMMFNNSNATRDGGYVRYHVREMTAGNRTALIAKLDEIISNFNTETASSSVQYGAALFDAFKYFGGHTNPASVAIDPANPPAPSVNPTYDYIPVFGTKFWGSNNADGSKPDVSAYSGENYNPVVGSPCGRNFIVFVGNGFPAKDDNASSNMSEVLRKLINPSSPAATIDEFPLTTLVPKTYSDWADLEPGACYSSAKACKDALPLNTLSTKYQCAQSTCGKNQERVQFATATSYTTVTGVPSANAAGRLADEFADFLRRTDINADEGQKNITTYAIDVYRQQQDADQTALMRNVAKYGGGKYIAATDEDSLVNAFTDIFSEILSVNSAFASASLPVSVNTQGTYLNQVFIGMFRPEKTPKWYGNLKQYQFRATLDLAGDISLTLADKDNQPAINSQSGFVSSCAKSYWTPSATDAYWALGESGSCPTTGSRASNSPDGEVVEKGGAAYKLRGIVPGDRPVRTCLNASCPDALANFNTSAGPDAVALGVTTAERDSLINWVRGLNVDVEVVNPSSTVMRPSVHGDVVHSRPLPIDYGGSTGVVVFYGGNDGMLRAINGNKPANDADLLPGKELWSFVAPEHFGKLKRLKNNSPLISFPGVNATDPAPAPKDYFFDGPIGLYRSGSDVWIYPTMRRGGRMVYAFDVSDPVNPTLEWKMGCPNQDNDTGCSTGFSAIGQTWSEPKVVKVPGHSSGSLIIMGGGYDTCEDTDVVAPAVRCAAPKGNRIFVIDADSGTLEKTLTTERSVAADITAVDSNGDGYVDVAYAVDTGANLYRIDIGSNSPGSWTIKKIAELGCAGSALCDRKFLHAPEVVVGADYNAVLMGSGNRERPLLGNAANDVSNAFFMIKDDRSSDQPLITTSLEYIKTVPIVDENGDPVLSDGEPLLQVVDTPKVLVSIDPELGSTAAQKLELASPDNKGWYLEFGSDSHDNEQVVTSAVVVAGVVYFSTHTPKPIDSSECSNLGLARGYAVNYLNASGQNGSALYTLFKGGGLPPSPVTGVVALTLSNPDGTTATKDGQPITAKVPFIIGGGGISGIDPTKVEVNPSGVRSRVYWYIDNE